VVCCPPLPPLVALSAPRCPSPRCDLVRAACGSRRVGSGGIVRQQQQDSGKRSQGKARQQQAAAGSAADHRPHSTPLPHLHPQHHRNWSIACVTPRESAEWNGERRHTVESAQSSLRVAGTLSASSLLRVGILVHACVRMPCSVFAAPRTKSLAHFSPSLSLLEQFASAAIPPLLFVALRPSTSRLSITLARNAAHVNIDAACTGACGRNTVSRRCRCIMRQCRSSPAACFLLRSSARCSLQ